ncbi:hypothetical protein ZOSMA_21G00760 [Zostera marina]|uniref:Uncharacterized protein n=1 Tax=Zostera marina TaxID=29655 RepID=A0A0K9PLY1_ZOSMR|nr:hypothetical protein ZOSMA_21G00760 [Zostera marina]
MLLTVRWARLLAITRESCWRSWPCCTYLAELL